MLTAMTVNDFIDAASAQQTFIISLMVTIPVLSFGVGLLHDRHQIEDHPLRYLYAGLIYLAAVPGMFALVLTGYTLLFLEANLLEVSLVIYFVPIVSMGATFLAMSRAVDFSDIPGFDRLWGLMVMIGLSFAVVLFVSRTRVWLFFGGSILTLVAMATVVFALIRWGAYMAFRESDEPKTESPLP